MSDLDKKLNDSSVYIAASQSLEQFVGEEISKIEDASLSDYIETTHFKEGKFIPNEFKAKGYTPSHALKMSYDDYSKQGEGVVEAKEDKKMDKKDEKDKPVMKDAAPPPPADSKDEEGAAVSTLKDQITSLPTIPEPKGDVPVEKRVPAINLTGTIVKPKFTDKFWSGVKYVQSEHNHDLLWYLDYGLISATTQRDTKIEVANRVREWIEERTFSMFGKFPREEEPMYRYDKITKRGHMGFDVHSAVQDLMHEDQARTTRKFLRQMSDAAVAPNPNKTRNRIKRFAAITDDEAQFQIQADAITRRRLGEVRELHEFLKPMRDMWRTLKPLPPLDYTLRKCYKPDEMRAWGDFMDKNFTLRNTHWDILENIVQTRVAINVEAKTTTIDELTKVISARNDSANEVDQYPQTLSKRAADRTALLYFTSLLASRFGKLSMPHIVLDDISLSTLADCIMAKVLIPYHCMNKDAVIDIDNYIARYLLPAFKNSYVRARDTFDVTLAESRQVNYLTEAFKNGVIRTSANGVDLAATRNFLLTTPQGGGWGNAGQIEIHNVPAAAQAFLQPRKYWYQSVSGRRLARNEIPAQFEFFVKFVEKISVLQLIISSPHDNVGKTLLKLLRWAATRRRAFAEMSFYAERVVRSLSYTPLVYPSDAYPENTLAELPIPTGGLYSFIAFMQVNGSTPIDPPIDLIHAGWKIHEDFNSFVFYYHHYRRYMTDSVFSRKDWVLKALEYSHSDSGFKSYLQTRLITDEELLSVEMPDANFVAQDWNSRAALVTQFINSHLEAFHISKSAYYYPNAPYGNLGPIQRFLEPKAHPDQSFTYQEVQELIADEKFAITLTSARQLGQMVEFKFPVNFDRRHVLEWKNSGSIIQLPTSTTVFSAGDIVFDYTFDEYVIDDTSADLAEKLDSNWLLPFVPFTVADSNYILTLFRQIEMDKFEVEIVTDLEFMATYST
jgi:hypothetical protein